VTVVAITDVSMEHIKLWCRADEEGLSDLYRMRRMDAILQLLESQGLKNVALEDLR
jgi:hypothetical protein